MVETGTYVDPLTPQRIHVGPKMAKMTNASGFHEEISGIALDGHLDNLCTADFTAGYEGTIKDESPLSTGIDSISEAISDLLDVKPTALNTSSPDDGFILVPMAMSALSQNNEITTYRWQDVPDESPAKNAISTYPPTTASSAFHDNAITPCHWQDTPTLSPTKETYISATPSLTGIPVELRLKIYSYLPIIHPSPIHLTYSPETSFEQPRKEPPFASTGIHGLLLACRRTNIEPGEMIYSSNEFLFTPGHQNYAASTFPDPHSVSDTWLSRLRLSWRLSVKKVHVYLDMDLQKEGNFVSGLMGFPDVEITVLPLFTAKACLHVRRAVKLAMLCRAIHEGREVDGLRTKWFAYEGDAEILGILEEVALAVS